MCITEYREELHLKTVRADGEARGRLEMLFALVADADITLERAAEKVEMDLKEFKKLYEASCVSVSNSKDPACN